MQHQRPRLYARGSGKPFILPSTDNAAKRFMLYGSATVPPISKRQLKPYRQAVQFFLKKQRSWKKDRDTLDMLREFEAFLRSLPTPPRQNAVRGMKAKARAYAVLATINRQQAKNISRPWNDGAALRLLCLSIAAEIIPKSISSPWYRRRQVVRAIRWLLKPDKVRLFGKLTKSRISVQGKGVTNYIYEAVHRHYGWWLTESRRQELLNTRWIKGHIIESMG
jgi:hypothetical protein